MNDSKKQYAKITSIKQAKKNSEWLSRHGSDWLAEQIDAVATMMLAVSERMEYYAGFKGELNMHAHEMAKASHIAKGWAKEIRKLDESKSHEVKPCG